ncbi:unnamed protein product [Schistocephalus solidus]|uniref:Secreted protein n=1 Tax=Schistocephalus solidus TaxID=70667 RepID=A0A183SBG6_SCHSO|nr:unnamed protein product [Schistocephalus solidus]
MSTIMLLKLLNILTVDQRTPITIHFTVDVVKWPAKIFSFSRRPNWFQGVSATANHRVRMRLKLANQFAHVQRQAAHNWPLGPPHSSLLYRWKLVTSLDKYLRPSCEANCGMDIMLLEISEQGRVVYM